jgi:hypothetical protein
MLSIDLAVRQQPEVLETIETLRPPRVEQQPSLAVMSRRQTTCRRRLDQPGQQRTAWTCPSREAHHTNTSPGARRRDVADADHVPVFSFRAGELGVRRR